MCVEYGIAALFFSPDVIFFFFFFFSPSLLLTRARGIRDNTRGNYTDSALRVS